VVPQRTFPSTPHSHRRSAGERHQLDQVVGADQVADPSMFRSDEMMSIVAILTVPPYPMM
jgi:hypothetical protein